MKHLLILLILLAGFINESSGQSSQKEAKQLYFSAVENYSINDIKSCISDLQKTKKILKSTNFKIQPLLIKALFKLHYFERTLEEISKYKALKPNTEWAEYHKIMQIHKRSNKYIKEIRSEYNKLLLSNKISPHYKFRKNNPKSSLIKKLDKRIDSLEYLSPNANFVNQKAYRQYNKRNYKKAIKLYGKVLTNLPENHEANFWTGNSYYDSNKLTSAYPFYKKAVELKPQDYYSNYWFGKINYDIKSYQLAITYLKKALSHKQNDYKSNYWLGHSYYKLNKLNSAINYFESAVKLKSYAFYANYWLGQAYSDNGQSKAAIPFFEKSSQLKPDDFWSQYLLGYSYVQTDDYTKAYEYLKKSVNMKSDHSYSNYLLGYTHLLRKEYSLAVKYLKIALKINPDDIYATYRIAKAYYMNRDMILAKEYFNKTIEMEKENESSLTAYAYFYLGSKEKAIRIMQSYASKANTDKSRQSFYCDYAGLHSLLNNRKETVKYLEMALKLNYSKFNQIDINPDFDNIREHRSFKKLISRYKN